MCGIVGIISKAKTGGFTGKESDTFTQLLYANQLRGSHGTGIFYNNSKQKGAIKTLKAPMRAADFVETDEYAKAETNIFQTGTFAIGHNRSATKGKIDHDCTHPFREQHITLVHNGTLVSQKELESTVEVDSHAICHSMVTKGELETLRIIDGAFALVWFNNKTKTLNMCRNYQRPLYIINTLDCYVICSELEMGVWILTRNNIKVISSQQLTTETLYSFDVNNLAVYTETKIDYKPLYTPSVTTFDKFDDYGKYGAWQAAKNSHMAKASYSTKKEFVYGERVRFRTGFVRKNGIYNHLEADFLRDQNLVWPPLKNDFEDQWRAKIYAPDDILTSFANTSNMEGTVKQTLIQGQFTTYVISDIKEVKQVIQQGTTLTLPSPKEKKYKCDWCGCRTTHLTNFYNSNVCDECAQTSLQYGC